jgi:hypothetical protein
VSTIETVRALLVVMLLVAAIVAAPHIAATQVDVHSALARFEGRFVNPLPDDGAAAIERAIASGVAEMNAMRRFIAERRLRENNPPIPMVEVDVSGTGLTVGYTGGRRHATTALDMWVESLAPDGGRLEVRHRFSNGCLIQGLRERHGGAEHVFVLSADGQQLEMRATITSPHIPRPISYAFALERAL